MICRQEGCNVRLLKNIAYSYEHIHFFDEFTSSKTSLKGSFNKERSEVRVVKRKLREHSLKVLFAQQC